MEPIPLKSPDGVAYTYACGRCHRVAGGSEKWGGKHTPKDIADLAAGAMENARVCCTCRVCGAYQDRDSEEERESTMMCNACWNKEKPEREVREAKYKAQALEEARLRVESLEKARDKNAAILLEDMMSDLSESYWCATWLIDLEHSLWPMVVDPAADRRFGCGDVADDEVAELRRLSDEAGGWWTYDRFHTLDEWKMIWDAKKGEKAT